MPDGEEDQSSAQDQGEHVAEGSKREGHGGTRRRTSWKRRASSLVLGSTEIVEERREELLVSQGKESSRQIRFAKLP